jgi:4-alpha-glucanotransferase
MIVTSDAHRQRIERLCSNLGIRSEWFDIWGDRHPVPAASRERLLEAMGMPAASPVGLAVAEQELENRLWRRVLPPAMVAKANEPITVEITLPATCGQRALTWAVLEESEELHDGQVVFGDLPLVGERTLDRQFVRRRLTLPVSLPLGYHRLGIEAVDGSPVMTGGMALIVVPERCYQPPAVSNGRRTWGTAIQLYSLRSAHNWGIGDFSDLLELIDVVAELGGDAIGLNPLHALFPHNPWHCSPYSPSSRAFLNVSYIDVDAVEDAKASREAQELMASVEFADRLASCREREIIDHGEVGSLKRWVLEAAYREFRKEHVAGPSERGHAFYDWVEERGELLELHAIYEALQEHFHGQDHEIWGWQRWPAEYRDPAGEAVRRFAEQHRDRVEFFMYLQWLAEGQLEKCRDRAKELGLRIGLYTDLAVSVDRAGAESWSNQRLYADAAAVGAPPDALAPQGQNWGLPPMIPHRLQDAEFAPFASTVRANMRFAGAIRIDHVMSLMRLYWVPEGFSGADGAYVHYPLEDLLGIVALESHRNRCLVIGEDLGTVPEEVRDVLRRWGVLSYRLLLFERDEEGDFLDPDRYPRQALVAASTHDLPTLTGLWTGRDLELRTELGLYPSVAAERDDQNGREQDRKRLLEVLQSQGLVDSQQIDDTRAALGPDLLVAIQLYLARTPSQLLMVQWEDILGVVEQANLPGTTDECPNWRRRLPSDISELIGHPVAQTLAEELAAGASPRGRR